MDDIKEMCNSKCFNVVVDFLLKFENGYEILISKCGKAFVHDGDEEVVGKGLGYFIKVRDN